MENIDINSIKNCLAKGDIAQSISNLVDYANGTPFSKEAFMIQFIYSRIKSDSIKGIISNDSLRLEENILCNKILDLTDKIDNENFVHTNNGRATVQLMIEGALDNFDSKEKSRLTQILSSFLGIKEEEIRIIKVISGSIIVTIDLPENSAIFILCNEATSNPRWKGIKNDLKILNVGNLNTAEDTVVEDNKYFIRKNFKGIVTIEIIYNNLNKDISAIFKNAFDSLHQEGVKYVILNLKNVKFIDSTGLSTILTGHRLWGHEGTFIVCGVVNDMVKKLIEISRLDTILNIFDTPEEAIKYIMFEGEEAFASTY